MRKLNVESKKILYVILLLALAAVFCAPGFAALSWTPISVAESYAEPSAVWGDKDTSELWYYGEDFLNIAGITSVIDGWELSANDIEPIIIAVVDTGLDTDHELFNSKAGKSLLVTDSAGKYLCYNAHLKKADDVKEIEDKDAVYHGTAVAGIIAMAIRELGLEDYIKIYPIKASYTDGSDEKFNITAVTEAIRYADEVVGADVINLSLGLLKSSMSKTDWSTDKSLQSVINSAAQNAVIVAAAGNGRQSGNQLISQDKETDAFYPASLDGVVSVMAYNSSDQKYKNSNYGDYDLIAPGENIYTAKSATRTSSEYQFMSGTSAAAPFVALSSALLKLRYSYELASGTGVSSMPGGNATARMLRNHGDSRITYSTSSKSYSFKKLDVQTLLTHRFGGDDYQYSNPTGLYISDNLPSAADDGTIKIEIEKLYSLRFIANLTPYGDTDPDVDSGIEWYVSANGAESFLGKGKNIDYFPPNGGEFSITASLGYGSQEFSDTVDFEVIYRPFISGDVRVTFKEQSQLDVKDAAGGAKLYTQKSYTFALTGVKYVDQSVPVSWYVNGELAGSGNEFTFTPKQAGTFVISAKYGETPIIAVNAFRADVRLFIERPLDMAAIIVSVILTAVVIAALTATAVIKKKKVGATDGKPRRE